MEIGWKPNVEIAPNCPRCGSSNTKFCYYNNYSLTQPRYFCKGCRRYWTKGGSLRNVPVGGGCRKNRRIKASRLSTDGVLSRSLAYGNVPIPNDPTGHSWVESTSSSVMPDGPHIDLAPVYANFLNQKPDSKTGFQLPELPSDFHSTIQFSSTQLSEGNGLFECHNSTLSAVSLENFQSANNTSNYGLPPLPGEDIGSQEVLWSSSQMMVNRTFPATQLPGLGLDAQDPNLLISNWSPFDLSSGDTFSGT